jgi:hypothetical protein
MTKTTLLGFLALGGLAALVSCDNGQGPTLGGLGANDCPYGTFRPAGLDECVFPANDVNNGQFGVSDNRCAFGQPASPPQCVSDNGERAYLSISTKCAPNYRFEPGACNRGGGAAGFSTGEAGAGPVNTGTAGAIVGAAGAAGGPLTGAGAIGGDSPGTAGASGSGAADATGAGTGSGGTG